MYSINISTEGIPEITAKLDAVIKGDLPNVKNAVKDSAYFVQERWRNAVATAQQMEFGGDTFAVRRRTGNYERSIIVEYPASGDGLAAIVRAMAPYADKIENGVEPYDMKPSLLKGRQYVRIPFRHAVPTAAQPSGTTPSGMKIMPQSIHAIMQKVDRLGKSSYGQRSKIIKTMEGERKTYTHKTGIYSGMKNVGKAGHSQYMTFRTVSIHSPANSWWHPGTKARPLSKAVAQSTYEFVKEILTTALEKDLEGMDK